MWRNVSIFIAINPINPGAPLSHRIFGKVEDEFKQIADALGINYLDLFLHVGEDFELLFTVNKELKDSLSEELNFYEIGEIIDENTVEIVLSNGTIEKISSKGYQHLE